MPPTWRWIIWHRISLISPPVHRDALINYLSIICSYDDLWASIPFLEYAFDELGETLQDPWTAYHDNIFRQSLFVMALQDLHHFLPRLQDLHTLYLG